MSKIRTIYKISREIKKLNHDIDLKIIKGLPYRAEARRHRFLASHFYGFYGTSRRSWIRRFTAVLASFML